MIVALRDRPAPLSPKRWRFPAFERGVLPNGTTVITCHMRGRPVVEIRLLLDTGARFEPLDMPGVATTAAAAIMEGTAWRDAEAFALDTESLGARFGVAPQWDAVVGNMSVPVAGLRPALALAVEAVTSAAMNDDDIDRIARRHAGVLRSAQLLPNVRADQAAHRAAFDEGSRMYLPLEGTRRGVEAITPDAVRRFWAGAVDPTRCTVVVVGDLLGTATDEILTDVLGGWTAPEQPAVTAPWPVDLPTTDPGVDIIDMPGAVQTVLALAVAGREVPVEDRAALRVANHYLGGFFGARLNVALREERSIAYGAGTSLRHQGAASTLSGHSSVQTDATAEAVAVVLAEARALMAGDVDDACFKLAKEHLVRAAAVHGKSAGSIASALSQLVLEHLPDDYNDHIADELAATTADDAAAAMVRHLDCGRLRLAAVGDGERIVEPLRALDWGRVSVEPFA